MDYHAALQRAAALDGIRPGVAACEVFKLAIDGVRKAGILYYDRSHVGHGIGIAGAGYDLPSLAPSDETPRARNGPLCRDTVHGGRLWGAQIEDMVVVTEEGYRPLTHGEAIAGGPMSAQTLMRLECMRCGAPADLDSFHAGCLECAAAGQSVNLTTVYDLERTRPPLSRKP